MNDLHLPAHRALIEELVARYVAAEVRFVASKEEIGGKLGRSYWNSPTDPPVILLPECITAAEIEESLILLALRGKLTCNEQLIEHADEIGTSFEYLKHLVLHEVAHIMNNWTQEQETDCDLWVWKQMHEGT